MRFSIVGVGQSFNLESKQMEDTLQVDTPQGVITIPTTNEAAQALITMAMNGSGAPQRVQPPPLREDDPMGVKLEQAFQESSRPVSTGEDFPDGAMVFGEEPSQDVEVPAQASPQQQSQPMFKNTVETLGVKRNPPDRSGVPSIGISRVDAKGNPMLPAPPDMSDIDEEEDPGEQI